MITFLDRFFYPEIARSGHPVFDDPSVEKLPLGVCLAFMLFASSMLWFGFFTAIYQDAWLGLSFVAGAAFMIFAPAVLRADRNSPMRSSRASVAIAPEHPATIVPPSDTVVEAGCVANRKVA